MTDRPVVSILMNCFNSDAYLREAIQSIIDQTYTNWELIFWDNQSTDASAEIVRSFRDPRIRYFYADEHTNLGTARNLAIRKCTGAYIAFLDCDDLWLPEKLEKQVNLFRKAPDMDFLYANYYLLHIEQGTMKLNHPCKQPEGLIFGRLLYSYSVGILTVMIRRAVLERQESLFDASLSLTEDYELFMRILYTSMAAYLHDPVAVYRIHSEMSSLTKREQWVEEYHHVNETFKKLDKEKRYSRGIAYRERHVVMTEALIHMLKGDFRKARQVIAPNRFACPKCLFVYIATFTPALLWRLLRPLWRRAVVIR